MGGSRNAQTLNSSSESYSFDQEGECVVCHKGPTELGPCNICISCDAEMGGEGVKVLAEQAEKKTEKKGGLISALDAA